MVSVVDVRTMLTKITTAMVPDETVQACIDAATAYVNAWKKTDADTTLVDKAILFLACYYTFMSYSETVLREAGAMPTGFEFQLRHWRETAEKFLELVTGLKGPVVGVAVTARSLKEITKDG